MPERPVPDDFSTPHRALAPRRRVAAVGLTVLAVVAAVGSAPAIADGTAPPSYVSSWLAINTGATNTVSLVTDSGLTTTRTQTLGGGADCAMTQGDKGLLLFSGTGPLGPGLNSGAIGVREKKNANGTSCSAVDTASAESLTLALQPGVGGLVAASASLDIDLKQSAQILATATLKGLAVPNGRYELRSGASITTPAPLLGGPVPAGNVKQCNNPADSGPDSGINNNCRWEISAPTWTGLVDDGIVFDSLTLTAVTGSFSLKGGADGLVDDVDNPMPAYFGSDRDASILELVQGTITCGQTATLRGTIASTWKRLDNTDGPGTCAPFAYSSRTGTDAQGAFAEFTKPLDVQTKAQALWTSTFPVANGGSTPPPIRVELDVFGSTEKILFDPLQPCPATYFDSRGAFVAASPVPTAATACLVSAVKGTGKLSKTATYTAYIFGDAGMRN